MSSFERELDFEDFVSVFLKKKDRVIIMPTDECVGVFKQKLVRLIPNEHSLHDDDYIIDEFKKQSGRDMSSEEYVMIFENDYVLEREIVDIVIWRNVEALELYVYDKQLNSKVAGMPLLEIRDSHFDKHAFYSNYVLEVSFS